MGTRIKVVMSVAVTPNNKLVISRVSAYAATSPAPADNRQSHELHQHESQNVCRTRAQRHSDPDFLRSLCHRIRNHTVNPRHRQHKREHRKQDQNRQRKATSANSAANQFIDRLNLIYGLVLIDFANRRLNCRHRTLRIDTRAYRDVHTAIAPGQLSESKIDLGLVSRSSVTERSL